MNNFKSTQESYTTKDGIKECNYLSMWNNFYIVNNDEFKSVIEKECSCMSKNTNEENELKNICTALKDFIEKANKCSESENTKGNNMGWICPRCNAVHGPRVKNCVCSPRNTPATVEDLCGLSLVDLQEIRKMVNQVEWFIQRAEHHPVEMNQIYKVIDSIKIKFKNLKSYLPCRMEGYS